jgi:hypothetical protein
MIECTFDEVFTFENLRIGHQLSSCGKRSKKQVVAFEANETKNLYEIYERLKKGGCYKYNYHSFKVYEPKEREIQTLCYPDRIIQRVLCDFVLSPYFTRHAIIDNCVCQKGKGTKFALDRFEKMLIRHVNKYGKEGYFLKCDILKYFATIPHDRLTEMICKHIRDEKLKNFVKSIIDSFHTKPEYLKKIGVEPLGDGNETNRGLPIGNQTSQVFGMFYLDPLDRILKEHLQIKAYSRYMDDFIIIHRDKNFLIKVLHDIELIVEELGLQLNEKTQIFPIKNGVTYLGFRFMVTDSGKIIKTVKKRTKRRIRWRVRLLKKAYYDGLIDAKRVKMSYSSIHGHIWHSKSYKLEREIYLKLKDILEQVKSKKKSGKK